MISLQLNDILRIVQGTIVSGNGNPLVNHAATEYSQIHKKKMTLFFHLNPNEPFKRLRKYKNVIIVSEKPILLQTARLSHIIIKVENIQHAFWDFIRHYRSLFTIPIIGITGTSGKTTTKEMIKQVLKMEGLNVKSTHKSFNSPRRNLLYFFDMDNKTDAAVIEMAVGDPGDVTYACKAFQPTIRILLNIGVYHLDSCKTMDNYIKAKAEILEGIKPEDILILNADDEYSKKIDSSRAKHKIYIGILEKADFMAKDIQYLENGLSFTLVYKNEEYAATIPGYGKHNVYNALASVAAVFQIGISIENAIKNLSMFQHLDSHLQPLYGINECLILDDTWNNTPPAMEGALKVLKDISKGKQKIAVLGYFPRIGESKTAEKEYQNIAKKVMATGIDQLIITDEKSVEIGKHASKLGMDEKDIHYCFTDEAVFETLIPFLTSETIVLLKFSKIRRGSLYDSLKKMIIH